MTNEGPLCFFRNRSHSPSVLQKVMRRSQHARKETEFLRLKRTRLGLDDFESLKVIGRGAFGEVRVSNGLVSKMLSHHNLEPRGVNSSILERLSTTGACV